VHVIETDLDRRRLRIVLCGVDECLGTLDHVGVLRGSGDFGRGVTYVNLDDHRPAAAAAVVLRAGQGVFEEGDALT
jgi:hypothetical protein